MPTDTQDARCQLRDSAALSTDRVQVFMQKEQGYWHLLGSK